ncbi:MAG: ABC transporter permease [Candidatus Hodarchaeota archaeon]
MTNNLVTVRTSVWLTVRMAWKGTKYPLFVSLCVLIVATSLIGGSNGFLTYITSEGFEKQVAETSIDLIAYSSATNTSELNAGKDTLADIFQRSEVAFSSFIQYAYLKGKAMPVDENLQVQKTTVLIGLPSDLIEYLVDEHALKFLQGSANELTNFSVGVSEPLWFGRQFNLRPSSSLNLTAGSAITCTLAFYRDLILRDLHGEYSSEENPEDYWIFVFVHISQFDPLFSLLGDTDTINPDNPFYKHSAYLLALNRLEYLHPEAARQELNRIQTLKDQCLLSPHIRGAYSPLQAGLEINLNQLSQLEMMFFLFAFPTILLGWYYSLTSGTMLMNDRRRLIGILKCRGVSDGRIFGFLLLEGCFLGILGGIGGLLASFPVLQILLLVFRQQTIGNLLSLSSYLLSFGGLVFLLGLGLCLGTLGILFPARQAIRYSPLEVIRPMQADSPQVINQQRRLAWVILVVCVCAIVTIFLSNNSSLLPLPLEIYTIVGVFGMISIVFVPFIPFLLVYSIIRLLTSSATFLARFFEVVCRPFAKELTTLIARNQLYQTQRLAHLAFILSLIAVFIAFPAIISASSWQYESERVSVELGSDIRIVSRYWDRLNISSETDLQNLSDGIIATTLLLQFAKGRLADNSLEIYGLNSSTYTQVVSARPYFTAPEDPEIVLSRVGNNTALISNYLAQRFSLNLGEEFEVLVDAPGSEFQISFKVGGFFDVLSGISLGSSSTSQLGTLVCDFDYLLDQTKIREEPERFRSLGCSLTYLLRTDPTLTLAETTQLTSLIEEKFPGTEISTLQEEIAHLEDSEVILLAQFFQVQSIFLSLMGVFGMGLLTLRTINDRKAEVGVLRSRGMSSYHTYSLLGGEILVLALFSNFLGVIIGSFSAYLLMQSVLLLSFTLIPVVLVIPFDLILSLTVLALSYIIITIVGARWLSRAPVISQLIKED